MPVDDSIPSPTPDQSPESSPKPGSWGARKRTPCKLCGVVIVQRLSGTREFCSRSCAIRFMHGLPSLRSVPPDPIESPTEVVRARPVVRNRPAKCEECGADFMARALITNRFCSRSCKAIHQKRTAKEEGRYSGGRKHTGEHKPCEVCGTQIYVKVWQAKSGQGRFCSKDCFNVWQARNSVERPCEWCGKSMTLSPSAAKDRRFCSWACQAEGRRTKALDRVHNGKRVYQTSEGYIYVWQPDDPRTESYGGWYPEHRLVVETQIGRKLNSDEHIHHKDGRTDNNDPANLQVVTAAEHQLLTRDQIVERRQSMKEELAELRAYKAAHEAPAKPD